MILTECQKEIVEEAIKILKDKGILYLALKTRVGKTIISLKTCESICSTKPIVFITKNMAMGSIKNDIKEGEIKNTVYVISMDSTHRLFIDYPELKNKECFFIIDEAHNFGKVWKSNKKKKDEIQLIKTRGSRIENIKKVIKNNEIIFLSGTPTPESYSQIYSQFYISDRSPFKEYKNFYAWFRRFGISKTKLVRGLLVNDYSEVKVEPILEIINPYMISKTQGEAGFNFNEVEEITHTIPMSTLTNMIISDLMKHRIYEDPFTLDSPIVCDTAAKYMTKIHQLCSGTVITEDGSVNLIDNSKVKFINEKYGDKKIAIYYKFIGERQLLEKYLKKQITKDSKEFNSTGQEVCFVSQFQSGREGVNLSSADFLIFFSLDYSYLSYEQTKNRIQMFDRLTQPRCVFLLSDSAYSNKYKLSFEWLLYKRVKSKKKFTELYFKKGF